MGKKFLSLCLALIMTLTVLSGGLYGMAVKANSDNYDDISGLFYKVKGEEVVIVGNEGNNSLQELVIPAEINNKKVTEIGYGAFKNCENLTSVIIPNTVTYIDDYAFGYCTGLNDVILPESVSAIGFRAFKESELKTITVLNKECKIVYPSDIEVYEYIYSDFWKIRCYAESTLRKFAEEYRIEYELIDDEILDDGNGLKYVIENGTAKIVGCEGNGDVILQDEINGYKVSAISDMAFVGKSFWSITIPASITTIGKDAFAYCGWLKEINVSEDNKYYTSVDGVLFSKDNSVLVRYPSGKEQSDYIIPECVRKIEDGAFQGNWYLRNIAISGNITYIGENAFETYEPVNVKIQDGVSLLQANSFSNARLLSISIPASVEKIEDNAFRQCRRLRHVFFAGTKEQWEKINEGNIANDKLMNTEIHYNVIEDDYIRTELETISCTRDIMSNTYCNICNKKIADKRVGYDYDTPQSLGHDYQNGQCTRCGRGPFVYYIGKDSVKEDYACIYGYTGEEENLLIPEEVDGYKVMFLQFEGKPQEWPENNKIKSLTVPKTVEHIDQELEWYGIDTIYGYIGSYAEKFANENGFIFIALDKNYSGDVDGDGEVSLKDYAVLQRYVAGWDVDISETNSDVNKDGEIDLKDYVLIQRYIAGWDVELK